MKQILEKKLIEIRKQKESTRDNYNAICGAEQVLLDLIKECEANKKTQEQTPEAE